MPKVILATGVEQLDLDVSRALACHGIDVTHNCHYQEGILPCCRQMHADTVIISPELPGCAGLEEIIGVLRRSPLNIRVILLPGPGRSQ